MPSQRIFERVFDIQHSADSRRDKGAFIHFDAAIGPFDHDLQGIAFAAHQANAHDFEPHIFDDRGQDLGHAPVDGGFGDEVVHVADIPSETKKRAARPVELIRWCHPVWTRGRRC